MTQRIAAEQRLSDSNLDRAPRAFFDHGFLIVESVADQELCIAIRSSVDGHYDLDGAGRPIGRIQDAWRWSPAVRRLATHPAVLSLLAGLYNRQPLPFQTLNFPVGTEQAAHSDTLHFDSEPAGFMCGVWVALEDIYPDSGPLVIYPGSHKLHAAVQAELGLPSGRHQYPEYEQRLGGWLEQRGLAPEAMCLRQGDAVVWHASLIHGGAARASRTRTRHSQVTHYFFDGCRYLTPLEQRAGNRYPRNPLWITPHTPGLSEHAKRLGRALRPGYLGALARWVVGHAVGGSR